VRQFGVHPVGADDVAAVVAVGLGLVQQSGQRIELLAIPGHQDRPGALDGDARGGSEVGEQPVPAADHRRLQGAGFGVEPGVQDRRVGLAGAVADVAAGLEQGDGQVVAAELTGDGGADDACPDDGDVMGGDVVVAHGLTPAYVLSARVRHADRNSTTRSACHRGSYVPEGIHGATTSRSV